MLSWRFNASVCGAIQSASEHRALVPRSDCHTRCENAVTVALRAGRVSDGPTTSAWNRKPSPVHRDRQGVCMGPELTGPSLTRKDERIVPTRMPITLAN